MKRYILIGLLILLGGALMAAVALYVPTNIPAEEDFSGLYYAELGLVQGVDVYDIPTLEKVALQSSSIPAETFYMPRFLYPPWYVLSAFYLGWLSIEQAATLWFEINLVLLFLSIWFLTDDWDGRMRLLAFPVGLCFLPVIGTLSVGQFDLPVLLGVAMLLYALRREHVALTTLGAVLLTFKPHLGGLIVLSVLAYLLENRNRLALSPNAGFGWRALRSIILAGILLFSVSFIADPHWLVRYPSLLLGLSSNYGQHQSVELCRDCANLPVSLSRWLFDGSLSKAALIALVLFAALCGFFYTLRKKLARPDLMLIASLLVTMLVSPYLFNYDFMILLIPFAVLWHGGNRVEKLVVGICYLVPTIMIIIYGRAGNISLLIATLILTALLVIRAKSYVDMNQVAAYNTST